MIQSSINAKKYIENMKEQLQLINIQKFRLETDNSVKESPKKDIRVCESTNGLAPKPPIEESPIITNTQKHIWDKHSSNPSDVSENEDGEESEQLVSSISSTEEISYEDRLHYHLKQMNCKSTRK